MEKIAQLINNGMTILGRKIDNLTMEIRNGNNRKTPSAANNSKTDFNLNLPDNVGESIAKSIADGFSKMKIPEPKVTLPDMKAPVVNIPPAVINMPEVKFPKMPVPIVNVPAPIVNVSPTEVHFPHEMSIVGMRELIDGVNREIEPPKLLEGISNKNPIPVQMVDSKGKPFTANDFGGGGGGPSTVGLRIGSTVLSASHPLPVTMGFQIPVYDTEVINEAGAPAVTIITYKKSGVTVATKTITVSGTTTTITVT